MSIFKSAVLNTLIEKMPPGAEMVKLTLLFALLDGAAADPDYRAFDFLDDLRVFLELEVV